MTAPAPSPPAGPAPVHAFWCRTPSRPNVGDALTPWLIRRVTGREPRFRPPGGPGPTLLVTGSIAALAGPGTTVWGAGVMAADDVIHPGARLLAVRGPRTRARALAGGVPCPEVYGDPALLLPRLHRPPAPAGRGIGLVAHVADRPRLAGAADLPPWVRLIDVQAPVEEVVAAVRACALVASSSLHGLVVAHAYGIPATWIEFRPLPSGDRTKFRDYFESVARPVAGPLNVTADTLDPDALAEHAVAPPDPGVPDLDALWDACPFRPGGGPGR